MEMGIGAILHKFAEAMARDPGETRALENASVVRANYALFAGVAIAFLVVILPAYFHGMAPWSAFAPDARIERSQWHVAADNGAPCGETARGHCMATPGQTALWQSPLTRADSDHSQRLQSYQGKDFWLAAELSPALLLQASQRDANHLLIGRFNALYKIWVDGELVASGMGRSETQPVILALPRVRLAQSASGVAPLPMWIAIQLHHQFEHRTPDLLNGTAGGEGFVTHEHANELRGMFSFWSITRPFSLLTAYFLVAWIFAYMWLSARQAREYFYMALHLIACALIQARLIDGLDLTLDTQRHYGLGFVFECYRAGFGLFLGLAFARTRRSVFRYGMPLLIILPWIITWLVPEAFERQEAFNFVRKWFVGPCYFLGATACVLQAWQLREAGSQGGAYLPTRVRRLHWFAAALFGVGAIYTVFAQGFSVSPNAGPLAFWAGAQDLVLVLFLAVLAAREHHHRATLVQKTPVSDYHRSFPLPESVSGILLVIDLKASEFFYRHRAGTGDERDVVALWRWQLYACATEFGGLTIHKKGDEVAVLFDEYKCKNPLQNALSAVRKMAETSKQTSSEFSEQGWMPTESKGFRFRAAICEASLKPVWEQIGPNREPAWEQVKGTAPFQAIQSMFKFEKAVQQSASRTLIVMPEPLLGRALELVPALRETALAGTEGPGVIELEGAAA